MIIFLIGSALSGMSLSMIQLICYRGLQGIGGGVLMSGTMQIVGEIFPPRERGKYMGIVTSMIGLASISGPTVGGFITDNLNWRWIFYVNLPFGILAMIVMFFNLPNFKPQGKRNIDYLGAISLIIALVPLLLAFSWAGKDYAWNSIQIIGMLVFSIVMLVVFVIVEHKAAEPIIPLSLFKNSVFVSSIIAAFLASVLMFSAVMFIPLFVQGVMGSSATSSGMVTTPMVLSQVITGIITGQIVSRTGKYKVLAVLCFSIATFGMILLTQLNVNSTNLQVVIGMIVMGIGIGISMPVFSLSVQSAFPQIGVVTSGLQFFRNIGGTIGAAVLGTIMTSSMSNGPGKLDLSKVPPEFRGALGNPQALTNADAMTAIKSHIPHNMITVFNSIMVQVKSVLATAIHTVFFIGIFVGVIGLIVVFFLKEIELKSRRG